jgi:hypothetical protein
MTIMSRPANDQKQGYGTCPDCLWYGDPKGCNVERDSQACFSNKKPRIEKVND